MNIRKKSLLIKIAILSIITILLGILIPHQSNAATELTINDLPYKMEFVKMDADWYLTMAIDSEGYLWGWGHSNHKVFGDNSTQASSVPKKINATMKFKDIAVSDTHILAIDENDNLYAWGENDDGELGIGSTSIEDIIEPQRVKGNTKFIMVDSARNSSMAIDKDGNLWSWGSRVDALGLGDVTENVLTPQKVSESTQFSKVSIGGLHTLALDKNGNLWSWGHNNYGQLGNESISNEAKVPTRVSINKTFKEIKAGSLYSMAIDVSGNIWTWGVNADGQLGNGSKGLPVETPTQVTTNKVFNKIAIGHTGLTSGGASYALDNEGHLWSWGNNEYYGLGNGTNEDTLEPTKVIEQLTFKEITAGQLYAIGIDTNGNSWSWGFHSYGARGTGYDAPYNKPTRFTGPDYVVTFKQDGQTLKQESVKFNKPATAPELPAREGYTLSWDKEYNHIMEDITINAIWTPNASASYKVIHHFRNLDLESEGFIDEEEAKTGTIGTTATAEYKTLEGFTKNEEDTRTVKEGIIAEDGSLVLHLYYTRNTYNIVYELNGGTPNSSLINNYMYGKEMVLQTRITKQGYTFAGWYDNEELTGSPITSIPATATGHKKFYAKWVDAEQEYNIGSTKYVINLEKNIITKVSPKTTMQAFLSKIDTNGQKKLLNLKGEEVAKEDFVGTGYKLQVTFKGETYTYEIAVRGDLDGNGKITTTDLSIINQQILRKIELTGIKKEAADTNYDGKLTTTDLSMINQAVLRKITL